MSSAVRVELPTGDVVWAKLENSGPTDVAAGSLLKLDVDQFRSTVKGVSLSLRSALDDLVPDQVQIEFGLEFAVKSGKVTSMLAEAGAKAAVKVTLTWSGNAVTSTTGSQTDDDS